MRRFLSAPSREPWMVWVPFQELYTLMAASNFSTAARTLPRSRFSKRTVATFHLSVLDFFSTYTMLMQMP